MTADFVVRLGRAIGAVLLRDQASAKVLIGKDTRISGYMLESALEAGLSSAGVDVVLLGPLPTPGVAYLTRTQGAAAGIVVSASHNPFDDNGIKLFSGRGTKLPDSLEAAIEAELEADFCSVGAAELGKAVRLHDAGGRYIEFVKSTVSDALQPLRGMRVVIDAAHGAAYQVGPNVLNELGLDVHAIGNQPDGLNINLNCGATDLAQLKASVAMQSASVGIALDGDADRLMMVTRSGRIVDGDDALLLLAQDGIKHGWLRGPVVGTSMTNFGIERDLQALGVRFLRANVGDRYVHEMLEAEQGILGGEASGHLLLLHKSSTGDGLISALQMLALMARSGRSLDDLVAPITRLPQTMINVRIQLGSKPLEDPRVRQAAAEIDATLAGRGRLVLRASGTEALIRVTVEGEQATEVRMLAEQLASVVRTASESGIGGGT